MKKEYKVSPYGTFVVDDEKQRKVASSLARGKNPQESEVKLFETFLDKESTFLDVGAHIGTISIPIAGVVNEVWAFEPAKENLEYLEENIRLNHVPNIRVFPIALGSAHGKVGLGSITGDAAGYSVEGEGKIELAPLDSLSSEPTFIKMDVEGHEYEVLKGARKTIEKYRPVIHFEVNLIETRKRKDWWLKKVETELKSHGYEIYLPTTTGRKKVRSIAWEMFKAAPKAFVIGTLHYSINFLALPK